MEIYVDELFFTNAAACVLLLFLCAKFMARNICVWRLILSGGLGGILSAAVFLCDGGLCALFKTAVIVLVPLCAFGIRDWRGIGVFALVMCIFSALIGVMASFFGLGAAALIKNGVLYIDIPPLLLAFMLILAAPVVLLFSKIIRTFTKRKLYSLIISAKGNVFSIRALYDSGNLLRNPYDNSPVIIAEAQYCSVFDGDTFSLIPIRTVGAESSLMKIFKADYVLIVETGKKIYNASIGVCSHSLSHSGTYHALIGSDFV